MKRATTRRTVLRIIAGLPLLAGSHALAREGSLIGRLIAEAQALSQVSQRIDFISRSLIGLRYQANTLIGGPRRKEVFVVREDAFDCVTFCEVVLAAARARNLEEFEAALLQIRYEHGQVKWEERNHYFGQWSQRALENKICQRVAIEPSIAIEKIVNWGNLGQKRVSLAAVPAATLLAGKSLLASGDVIGFVSKRSNLDFYHTGLIAFAKDGALLLRHASRSRRRILDERMDTFVAVNRVRYVTLLRAAEVS
jgi:N-acetylmuramoyl-L-alanine amidase-like protein